NAIVGLNYQSTGGAYIYRRSIAQATWGTDDPAAVASKIGPGWDQFWSAAADLSAKGYKIVSGDGDLWHPVENASSSPWVVDGKLNIAPEREAFLDMSKKLTDNSYSNGTVDWQDAWFADMKGNSDVLGFFGPAWLINYVMVGNSGAGDDLTNPVTFQKDPATSSYGDWAVCNPPEGFFWGGTWLLVNKDTKINTADLAQFIQWVTLDTSETGLQYQWANGTLYGPGGTKDAVSSGVVMAKSDGTLPFLGGQNMFDIFVPAGQYASAKNLTQYDESINSIWRDQVRLYTSGAQTKDETLTNFKQLVSDQLGIPAA
ncbi:MAG: carbohydrate ABC transporter substrate-binding protein, partial [Firmicutes bacterium]|nr:carbohydrate ABC transporter substrate-binding protein [Bacillota bacterium]